ncbi:MAG TPA: cytochrome c [Gaiellaceae bacterium]|nr:cytochrome c [Gaiellaceae bacterium]
MRRLVPFALLALLLAACGTTVPGGKHVTTPTAVTVIGKAPQPPAAVVGDAAAGKALFVSTGCGACHVFTPAGTTGKVGPNLDNLAAYAKAANQGALPDFVKNSITDPGAYVAPGFSNIMPGTYAQSLSPKQLADVVAFLAKGP